MTLFEKLTRRQRQIEANAEDEFREIVRHVATLPEGIDADDHLADIEQRLSAAAG